MTSIIYQQQSKKIKIVYRIVHCDLGYLLLATTDQGICSLKVGDHANNLVKILAEEFKQATIIYSFTGKSFDSTANLFRNKLSNVTLNCLSN